MSYRIVFVNIIFFKEFFELHSCLIRLMGIYLNMLTAVWTQQQIDVD